MNSKKIELLQNALLEKRICFLIGAGASAPYFSALGNIEELLTNPDYNDTQKNFIKIIFFLKSIKDNQYILNLLKGEDSDEEKNKLMHRHLFQYIRFFHNTLEYLKKRNSRISPRRTNLFTTNYDLFFEAAIEKILIENPRIFFNDGANGYITRLLNADNFNKTLLFAGTFDNYTNEMLTINLVKFHGSVNWKEYSLGNLSKINVVLDPTVIKEVTDKIQEINQVFIDHDIVIDNIIKEHKIFGKTLMQVKKNEESYKEPLESIAKLISKMQIVMPTKQKFNSTVLQEHFYSMLRVMSYELEKKQTCLVCFGFSFADEHIVDIIQRSLNNPFLVVIIFCYTDAERKSIISRFNFNEENIPNNIKFISPSDFIVDIVSEEKYSEDEKWKDLKKIKDGNNIIFYNNVISIGANEDVNGNEQEFPCIDFNSLNSILESGLEASLVINEDEENTGTGETFTYEKSKY